MNVGLELLVSVLAPGDIVAFSRPQVGFKQQLCGALNHTPFYHAGIVSGPNAFMHFLDPRDVPEIAGFSQRVSGGLYASRIDRLLETYDDDTLFCVMTPRPAVLRDSRAIESAAASLARDKPYDVDHVRNYLYCSLVPRKKPPDALHCTMFVGLLLERLGALASATSPVTRYIPGKLERLVAASGAYTIRYFTLVRNKKEV